MENLPAQHPVAIEHLPSFITAPGQSDMLLNIVIVFSILMVLLTEVFYLKLHSIPERMSPSRPVPDSRRAGADLASDA